MVCSVMPDITMRKSCVAFATKTLNLGKKKKRRGEEVRSRSTEYGRKDRMIGPQVGMRPDDRSHLRSKNLGRGCKIVDSDCLKKKN